MPGVLLLWIDDEFRNHRWMMRRALDREDARVAGDT